MTRHATIASKMVLSVALMICAGSAAAAEEASAPTAKPERKWIVYLLPHSHIDIGYTDIQTNVERRQIENLDKAMELCRKTAEYPIGAQFRWNTEGLWAVDGYLRTAPPEKQQQLIDAVRTGQIELQAMYANPLTGLYRPEELVRLMQWSVPIGRRCGVKAESAMINDVPGWSWGAVSALAEAGVKYLVLGPNSSARCGRTVREWEDKPFYWLAPDRRQKVLCWIGHLLLTPGCSWDQWLPERLAQLEQKGYPYDIVQMPCFTNDNCPPDESLSDVVKDWNAKHEYPKLVIATVSEAMKDFEDRYADKIPAFAGEITPYWEDGAASSARETAINRAASERLVQAETLWAMLDPQQYPIEKFWEAWRNVVLYDEHTWGARQYNVDINSPFVTEQWRIKQAFALDGDAQSRELLDAAMDTRPGNCNANAVDVWNTSGWPRTELVVVPGERTDAGQVVTGPGGESVPSQRLVSGELAFLAKNVPGLAGRRYLIGPGEPTTAGAAKAENATLTTSTLSIRLDPASGAIESLKNKQVGAELSDAKSGVGLNRYYYVIKDHLEKAQQVAGPVKINVQEPGPLVASLRIESDAPGCASLRREVRVVDGLDRVDIVDVLDKNEVLEKEGVHLGFAFHVPDGVMRIDTPWAVIRPELDQLPGSCKEWLTVGRWVDVSNREYGVTWATPDAPMIEVGSLTAGRIGPSSDPNVWLSTLVPSQTLYSWVMNNYWYTNYRAFQSGPTTFRYGLLPHKRYDAVLAQRFGIECSQPLVVAPARGNAPTGRPFLELDTPKVIVASIKPSEDRTALIVRLFGAGGQPAETTLHWGQTAPKNVWISNLAEEKVAVVKGPIDVPAFGLVTLRVE